MISPESVLAFTKPDSTFYEDNLLAADDWVLDPSFPEANNLAYGHNFFKESPIEEYHLRSDSNLVDSDGSSEFFSCDSALTAVKEEPQSPYSFTSLPSSPEQELCLEASLAAVSAPSPIASPSKETCLDPPQSKRRAMPCNAQGSVHASPVLTPNAIPSAPQHILINTDPNSLQKITNGVSSPKWQLPIAGKPRELPTSQPVAIKLENSSDVIPNLLCVNVNGLITSSQKPNQTPTGNLLPATASSPIMTTAATSSNLTMVENKPTTVKAEKRQQRMIKNRESASLSRKRKKEYLKTLEERINLLTSFNTELKTENESLKMRVHSLENENLTLKKHPNETIDSLSPVKKTTCLLAVVFLLSLNISSLRSSSKSISNTHTIQAESEIFVGRHLLQVQENELPNHNFNYRNAVVGDSTSSMAAPRGKLEKELSVVLKDDIFKSHHRNSNEKLGVKVQHSKRKKRQSRTSKGATHAPLVNEEDMINFLEQIDCATYFNKTDASRITKALQGLVRRQSRPSKHASNVTEQAQQAENCTRGKWKPFKTRSTKRKPSEGDVSSTKAMTDKVTATSSSPKSDVLVYQSRSFADFIQRQDDTFYVMSLRPDHFILPARRYNNTQRPKVSFMLPAINDTRDGDTNLMQLMQIDCHVMDMKVISVDKNILPQPTAL